MWNVPSAFTNQWRLWIPCKISSCKLPAKKIQIWGVDGVSFPNLYLQNAATIKCSGLACAAGRLSGSSRGKTPRGVKKRGQEASTESTCRCEDVVQLTKLWITGELIDILWIFLYRWLKILGPLLFRIKCSSCIYKLLMYHQEGRKVYHTYPFLLTCALNLLCPQPRWSKFGTDLFTPNQKHPDTKAHGFNGLVQNSRIPNSIHSPYSDHYP